MQKGGRGMKGGAKVAIEGHRHSGIFIARGKEDALVSCRAWVSSSAVESTRMHCVPCIALEEISKLLR